MNDFILFFEPYSNLLQLLAQFSVILGFLFASIKHFLDLKNYLSKKISFEDLKRYIRSGAIVIIITIIIWILGA